MNDEREKILQAIALLDAQRSLLGDDVVNTSLAGLRQYLRELDAAKEKAESTQRTPMDGERRLVTVIFADFSNFTEMAGQVDSEDLRAIMNAAFSELVPIIEHYGGYVDKFIGDEIMALFGAPVAHEDDAECALRAALDMMKKMEEFNTRKNQKLGLHFGINTGMVIAGGVGSTERQQYSVIGEAVNLAARLEDASITGEILVGNDTFRQVEAVFDFEKKPPVTMKGIPSPVPVYRLIGLKSQRESSRGLKGLHAPMIGREEDLRTLLDAFTHPDLSGQAISIVAEPGLGKSRLVEEFRKLTPSATWTTARGQSFSVHTGYGIVKDMINAVLKVEPGESIANLSRILQENLVRWSPGTVADTYPYLARLAGIPMDSSTDKLLLALPVDTLRTRMAAAFGNFLEMAAAQQPLIVCWEDLHWADDSSLELLGHVIGRARPRHTLNLLVFRTQEGTIQSFHTAWKKSIPDYREILLSPLRSDQCSLLIDNLLQIGGLPDDAKALLVQKSDGNPFFLEELVRSLMESGFLRWDGSNLVVEKEIAEIKVPDTLHGVIESRIDRLTAGDKQALQNASVIGRVFGKQVLGQLLETGTRPVPLDTTLVSLKDKELILQKLLMEFVFRHAITQDVAYNSLLKAQRSVIHRRAGEIIETLYGNRIDEVSSVLAHHFKNAQHHEKACLYQSMAADRARITFSYKEALYYYQEALREAEQLPEKSEALMAEILERTGEVYVALSKFDEGRDAYRKANQLLPSLNSIVKARLTRKAGESYVLQRNPAEELKHFEAAIEILNQATEKTGLWTTEWLDIQLARSWSLYWLNRVPEMDALLSEIEPVCMQQGTPRQQGIWYGRRTIFILRKQRYRVDPSQLRFPETALILSTQVHDHTLTCHFTALLGMMHLYSANPARAASTLLDSHKQAIRIANVENEIATMQFLCIAHIRLGDVDKVREIATGMEARVIDRMPFYLHAVNGFYAWLSWRDENLEEAEHRALESLRILNNAPIPNMLVKVILVDVYTRTSRISMALDQLHGILLPYQEKISPEIEMRIAALLEQSKLTTLSDDLLAKGLHAIVELLKGDHYL